jgi:omega-hydroxy-beta-dihydromenaquinone-9 sulfotransferase
MDCMVKMDILDRISKKSGCSSMSPLEKPVEADYKVNARPEQKSGYVDRPWIPRFWDGMCPGGWFSLLIRNRFAVSPIRIGMAVLIGVLSLMNFFLWLLQAILLGRKIARAQITQPPLFVIGHWRSGTTLLHELLVRDARHTYPDTYACFAPNHFLLSGWLIKPCLRMLLPTQRPMDNMPAGWDRPQEDEFALCNMGVPSPYLTITFPNRLPQCQEYLDMTGVPPESLKRWKHAFLWFLKCMTLRSPKRIVLKSPPHTARIRTLLDMFPDAKFVHIIRDPHVIFPSTMNLWKRLYLDQGLQTPTYEGLDEHVYTTFTRMYEAFERDRGLLGPGQLCDVRYENLIADPVGQMRRVYQDLRLGEFNAVQPEIEKYFAGQKDYKTNRYQITPEMRAEVGRRWGDFLQRYGYADDAAASQPAVSGNGQSTTQN